MKRFAIMILLVISIFTTTSCCQTYNQKVEHDLNYELTPPVILIGKENSDYGYSITVRDANNIVHSYGNTSILANNIGFSMNVGDTIVHERH